MSEISQFGDRSTHRDRNRVIRTRVGTGAGASPVAETVAARRFSSDRNRRSAVFPAAARSNGASSTVGHGQVVLGVKAHRIGLVRSGSYCVGQSSVITPIFP